MGVKLDQKTWDAIEVAYFKGQSANSLAKEYGVSEAGIRKRLKGKKADKVEDAVVKVVEARKAVEALPAILRPYVDTLAESRMRIIEAMAQSGELAAKTALRMSQIANLQASKLDEESPDKTATQLVHGLMETANKAAYQPLELLKASKGADTPQDESPKTTLDVAALSSTTRRELLEARGAAD